MPDEKDEGRNIDVEEYEKLEGLIRLSAAKHM